MFCPLSIGIFGSSCIMRRVDYIMPTKQWVIERQRFNIEHISRQSDFIG
jgi:hypothetical protein